MMSYSTYVIKNQFKIVHAVGRWQAYDQALGQGLTNVVLVRLSQ